MTTKSDLEELFFRRKPARLLRSLMTGQSAKYVSVLSKQTDCTYSHTVKLLNKFRALGLVTFEKEGRVKYIHLTDQGKQVGEKFLELLRQFSKTKAREEE